jgi:FkbM family methyltransferase
MNANVNPEAEEKELVWEFFDQKRDGVFVEVGANDPVTGSQTWLLEQNGWQGVLVEPQASLCEKLRSARLRSRVFQVACSCPGSEGEADLILTEYDGNATLKPQRDSHGINYVGAERVRITTLDSVLQAAGVARIDFVSLDVEGHEIEVMHGFNFEKYKPSLILIEDGVRDLAKHRFLKRRGYKLVKRTTLNNWYVPKEHPFKMSSWRERWGLVRKMYLGLPFRKLQLLLRRRRQRRALHKREKARSC